ncbi:MAG: DUF1080 domain-containing protein [Phycisphaerae bacterium]
MQARRNLIMHALAAVVAAAMMFAAHAAGRAAEAPDVTPKAVLGAKPPKGAVVLIPYEPGTKPSLEAWNKPWKASPEGYVVAGGGDMVTRRAFGSMRLHLEFCIPPGPDGKRASHGGNSGVYIMDRYEVQILDSHGRKPQAGGCGGIYRRIAPKVNAALPAGEWQSYDITLDAPRFDAAGNKVRPVHITVVHNGVTIHDDVEVPKPTGRASGKKEVPEAPLRLQDHGCPVRFRNVWLVPLED